MADGQRSIPRETPVAIAHGPRPVAGRAPELDLLSHGRQAFRRAAVLVGAAVLLLGICFVARLGGPHTVRTLSNVALFCAAFAAAVGCLVRSRRLTGRVRLSWVLLGAA